MFCMDTEGVNSGDIVLDLGWGDLGRFDDGDIVESRDEDEDGFLFLRQFLDLRC